MIRAAVAGHLQSLARKAKLATDAVELAEAEEVAEAAKAKARSTALGIHCQIVEKSQASPVKRAPTPQVVRLKDMEDDMDDDPQEEEEEEEEEVRNFMMPLMHSMSFDMDIMPDRIPRSMILVPCIYQWYLVDMPLWNDLVWIPLL